MKKNKTNLIYICLLTGCVFSLNGFSETLRCHTQPPSISANASSAVILCPNATLTFTTRPSQTYSMSINAFSLAGNGKMFFSSQMGSAVFNNTPSQTQYRVSVGGQPANYSFFVNSGSSTSFYLQNNTNGYLAVGVGVAAPPVSCTDPRMWTGGNALTCNDKTQYAPFTCQFSQSNNGVYVFDNQGNGFNCNAGQASSTVCAQCRATEAG